MKVSKTININKTLFNLIILFLGLKLLFSYLLVDLGYWLRHLIPNHESYNVFGVPQKFSSKVEFFLIPSFVLYLGFNLRKLKKYHSFLEVLILLLILNFLTSIYNSIGILDSIQVTLKLMSPILFFIILLIHYEKYRFDIDELALKAVKFCGVLCVIGLVFFNPSSNRGLETYLPIFFESIHTHSYVLISMFVIISFPLYIKKKNIILIIFFLASFLFLWKGYAIRTAMIVYLLYILAVLFNIHTFFKYLWIKTLVYGPLIFLLVNIVFLNINYDQVSSGRLSMYSEKLDQIKDYNFLEVLLGRGQGSDLIRTKIWASTKKGAHSDIITYFVENGNIYAILFLYLIVVLFLFKKKLDLIFLSLISGYFLSSIISNGIASRPIAGYLFFLSLAFMILYRKRYNESLINTEKLTS